MLASLPHDVIDHYRKTEKFYCPECASPLIIRAGSRVIPHFAHRSTTLCALSSNGESAYHQKAKVLLFQWLQQQNIEVKLEFFLQEIKQRPDILFSYDKKIFALEFQHTHTNIATIQKRNEGYKKLNIIPLWILGASFFKRTSTNSFKVNDFILQFIHQFSPQLPTSAYYFSPEQQMISFVNDLHLSNQRRALASITYEKLSHLVFKDLFLPRRLQQRQLFASWKEEKRKLRISPNKSYGLELKWRRWLYNQQLHLEHLPSIVHLPTPTQHYFKVPPWNWQSRFIIDFLHPLPIGHTFTKAHVDKYLRPYLYPKEEYPLLYYRDASMPYLNLLIQLHYIKKVNGNTFMKSGEIKFYDHIEHAIAGDDELLRYIMYNHN